jgi:sulfonate transport system ATP-binding protein
VLKGINLDIIPGEFVAIVGRSGCGKSTLLRLVAGLEKATEGQIYVDSSQINGIHDFRSGNGQTGMVRRSRFKEE